MTTAASGADGRVLSGQIVVLKHMSVGTKGKEKPRKYGIDELAVLLGTEERDVQRYLYILEGHKYVSPHPAGDFTSRFWQITPSGADVVKNLHEDTPRIF